MLGLRGGLRPAPSTRGRRRSGVRCRSRSYRSMSGMTAWSSSVPSGVTWASDRPIRSRSRRSSRARPHSPCAGMPGRWLYAAAVRATRLLSKRARRRRLISSGSAREVLFAPFRQTVCRYPGSTARRSSEARLGGRSTSGSWSSRRARAGSRFVSGRRAAVPKPGGAARGSAGEAGLARRRRPKMPTTDESAPRGFSRDRRAR